jgi:hypothetical protein
VYVLSNLVKTARADLGEVSQYQQLLTNPIDQRNETYNSNQLVQHRDRLERQAEP